MTTGALLPQAMLDELAADPTLGSGNCLHYAFAANPKRDSEFIWLDHEVRAFSETYTSLSLSSLKSVVDRYAAWYSEAGVVPRDLVAVYVGNNFTNPIHFFALTGLGAIPVLINGNMDAEIAALFIEKMGAIGLFADDEHYRAIEGHLRPGERWLFQVTDTTVSEPSSPLPSWYPYVHSAEDPTLICHSSGTTGIPKGIINLHQQFFYGPRHCIKSPPESRLTGLASRLGDELSLRVPQRGMSAYPHSHSAGISFLTRAVLTGVPIMIVADQRPKNVLRLIGEFAPTTFGAFSELYAKLSQYDLTQYQLSSVQTWLNTGDTAHEAHIRPLVNVGSHVEGDRLVPGSTFVDRLGSSEMGFAMLKKEYSKDDTSYDRCVGTPFDFIDAQVLGEHGEIFGDNQVGMLGFRSPTITPGYWNDSEKTYLAQRAGYWMTGDVGYRDEAGLFYHLDRAVDVIHTRNGNVYTLPTEERIQKACPDIADVTVIGVDAREQNGGAGHSEPVAIIWAEDGEILHVEALLNASNLALQSDMPGHGLSAMIVVECGDVPFGATGKVIKRELRTRYRRFLADPGVRASLARDFAIATPAGRRVAEVVAV
ncbi:MAG: acyl--CoA ligase [Proteobacteria bacterium]|nr:acyl--CoA ligase [Pseudomonadota bacterium]